MKQISNKIEGIFKYINLGEHGVKLFYDGWLVVYENPTGGDSVLLVTTETGELFALLSEHEATFQGAEPETVGVDPYCRELSHHDAYPHPVQLFQDGKLILKEGAITIDLKRQEVDNLYKFLIAHCETFQIGRAMK